MSALNRTETEALQEVHTLLYNIYMSGFDPKKLESGSVEDRVLAGRIKEARTKVRTIIQVKGHYPK